MRVRAIIVCLLYVAPHILLAKDWATECRSQETWVTNFNECQRVAETHAEKSLAEDDPTPTSTPSAEPRLPLCKDITKLRLGMTKKRVSKLFGEPTYSSMMTCGGLLGKPWPCEQLSYPCRSSSDFNSSIHVTYDHDRVNSWE